MISNDPGWQLWNWQIENLKLAFKELLTEQCRGTDRYELTQGQWPSLPYFEAYLQMQMYKRTDMNWPSLFWGLKHCDRSLLSTPPQGPHVAWIEQHDDDDGDNDNNDGDDNGGGAEDDDGDDDGEILWPRSSVDTPSGTSSRLDRGAFNMNIHFSYQWEHLTNLGRDIYVR